MLPEHLIAAIPEDVGIDSERLESLFARAKRDVDDGGLPSATVAVARQGKLAGFRTFGQAVQGGVMRPVSDNTLFCIYSATKGIVSVTVWALFEEGLLRLDERIADIIPEFASNGKADVTVEQALLHVGGFPGGRIGRGRWEHREERLRAFSEWTLEWEPGSRFQYHPTALHWVLAEIIERRTGMDYRQFVDSRILKPMRVQDLYVGLSAEQNHRVADVVYVQRPAEPPEGWGEVSPDFILDFNRPEVRAVGVPGAGGIARAAELAMFYQPLVNGGQTVDGTRILKAETIEWATRVRTTDLHREGLGSGIPVNRALGVVVAGADGMANNRGFGRATSPGAFGHAGAGGQVAWGDPATGISVGYCTNGFVDTITSGRRMTAIGSLAAATAIEAPGTSSSAAH